MADEKKRRTAVKTPKGRYYRPSDTTVVKLVENAAGMLQQLKDDIAAKNAERGDTFEHMVKLFTSSHSIGMPEQMRYVKFDAKSSKPADVILRVMGMLTVPMKFQYVAPKGTAKADQNNDKIERFLNAFYPWLFRRGDNVRWDFQATFWQLLVGRSYLQQSYDPYYWDKDELRRQDDEKDDDEAYNERVDAYRQYKGPPIKVQCLDPRTVHPVETPMGNTAYVKHYRVQRYDLEAAFWKRGKRIRYDEKGKVAKVEAARGMAGMELPENAESSSPDAVEYFEYIDDVFCFYVVDGEVIDSYQHNGGIKICPAYGLQTGLTESHLSSLGILWTVRNEIPQYDFGRTLWANKAYISVFPAMAAILPDNENPITNEDGTARTWNLQPGTVIQMRGHIEPIIKDGEAGMDYRSFVETQAQEIDAATISGLARGQAGAQQPGYAINQLTQGMRTHWKPIIDSRTLQASMLGEHFLYCMAHHVKAKTGLYVESIDDDGRKSGEYIDFDPDDLAAYYRVDAEMEPDLPIDRQGNMMSWAEMYTQGLATWEELTREGFGKTNPIARRMQAEEDQFRRNAMPKVIEDAMALGRVMLGNDVLKSLGLDKVNEAFSMDLQALKDSRTGEGAIPGDPAAGGAPPAQPGAMPLEMPPQVPGGNVPAGTPQDGSIGIEPTFGANPVNPTPGPRLGG